MIAMKNVKQGVMVGSAWSGELSWMGSGKTLWKEKTFEQRLYDRNNAAIGRYE